MKPNRGWPMRRDVQFHVVRQCPAIENQIERTDHRHLGQLLTYASGLQAKTVVWISGQIGEEHCAAIDWLNLIANRSVRFFGIEIDEVDGTDLGDTVAALTKTFPLVVLDMLVEQSVGVNGVTKIMLVTGPLRH